MSATIGSAGELERITGVRSIAKLPVPEGWEKQSSGRRFFLFPSMTLGENDVNDVTLTSVGESGRAVMLIPRNSDVQTAVRLFEGGSISVLGPEDIEESLEPFTTQEHAVLVLANRYDGLDLPGDVCRLLIVAGYPAGANLQERFLLERLAASAVLRNKLLTRFTQGVGRCCRSATDYAAVIVSGQRLLDFCAKHENRSSLHPELQAEVLFGIEQSGQLTTAGDFISLLKLFFAQGKEWEAAENDIVTMRQGMNRVTSPSQDLLARSAPLEVDYTYAIWSKDYHTALEKAIGVADNLKGIHLDLVVQCYRREGIAARLGLERIL